MTKLAKILEDRNMTQRDLRRAIFESQGVMLGDDRISKMVSGKLKNIHIKTAKLIADTLQVSIDSICEF